MTDDKHGQPGRREFASRLVDLGYERTRRVHYAQPARFGLAAHRRRNAVRRKKDRRAGWNIADILDEDKAARTQPGNDDFVVH
jgi:hypothetical protein